MSTIPAEFRSTKWARAAALMRLLDLVFHLAKREIASMHRWTLLGWTWPLARQLAQLAVLVFAFSQVLDLGIPNYPVFVFSGLIAWTWFSTGVAGATSSILSRRHLAFQPRCPLAVLPLIAVTVPVVDVLMALPVLLLMLVVSGVFQWTLVLLPALLFVQLVLMVGIGWFTSAISVYLRDVPNIVAVGLVTLFYMTPVFFSLSRVPQEYEWILMLNPMATLIESYRAVVLGGPFPPLSVFLAVALGSVLLAGVGLAFFRRTQKDLVDQL